MTDLFRRSIEVIRDVQAPSGAYYACPEFEHYRYCWFRDGSFVADAMSMAGERESAEAFFDWGARAIERHHPDLHARYTVEGEVDGSEWPKRQWDGYGLFLWALARHRGRHGAGGERWRAAVELVVPWLAERFDEPCVDWWEERDGIHAATRACIAAGLAAAGRGDLVPDFVHVTLRPDASELALGPPVGDEAHAAVVARVEPRLLSAGGGLHRYEEDTYYGGGEWLLLTAMSGIAHARRGRAGAGTARRRLQWVEAHATADGLLPEQSQDYLLAPELYEHWMEKWGPPPCPLLWSHAMYLHLAVELGAGGRQR